MFGNSQEDWKQIKAKKSSVNLAFVAETTKCKPSGENLTSFILGF